LGDFSVPKPKLTEMWSSCSKGMGRMAIVTCQRGSLYRTLRDKSGAIRRAFGELMRCSKCGSNNREGRKILPIWRGVIIAP
jgi:hypothetical protein